MGIKEVKAEPLAVVAVSITALFLAYRFHTWVPLFGVPVVMLAYSRAVRGERGLKANIMVGGIVGLFVSMLVIFYIVGALINPVESAVTTVTSSLQNSTFTEVQNISDLPKVSYLIGLISVIVGIIYIAWGRE